MTPGPLSRRVDLGALAIAFLIEALLLAAAAFGGPHGTLGALPWTLQLPGILFVLWPPGGALFPLRVALLLLVQLALWYVVVAGIRRARRRARAASPTARPAITPVEPRR